MDAVLN